MRVLGALLFLFPFAGIAVGAFGPAGFCQELAENGLPCPFFLATGLVCPFCGLTHATLCIGMGDWMGSFHHHPLAALILVLIAWGGWFIFWNKPMQFLKKTIPAWAILGVAALIWVVKVSFHY